MTNNKACILCLGNFDGVHLGHQALFERALAEQKRFAQMSVQPAESATRREPSANESISAPQHTHNNTDVPACGALTFKEPTYKYLKKDPPPRITTAVEREKLLLENGMQFVASLDFAEIRDMSPETFVRNVLIGGFGCVMTVCGYNYRFGRGGSGDSTLLYELMEGRSVTVPPVLIGDTPVSSTAIRAAVASGDMETANSMLGRSFRVVGTVLHGHGVGAKLGFATVNQHFTPGALVPARGVYASRCIVDGQSYPAVSNVGCRPTFEDGDEVLCETHILGRSIHLYGREITTELYHLLRPERKFDSPEALRVAVMHDIASATKYFEVCH